MPSYGVHKPPSVVFSRPGHNHAVEATICFTLSFKLVSISLVSRDHHFISQHIHSRWLVGWAYVGKKTHTKCLSADTRMFSGRSEVMSKFSFVTENCCWSSQNSYVCMFSCCSWLSLSVEGSFANLILPLERIDQQISSNINPSCHPPPLLLVTAFSNDCQSRISGCEVAARDFKSITIRFKWSLSVWAALLSLHFHHRLHHHYHHQHLRWMKTESLPVFHSFATSVQHFLWPHDDHRNCPAQGTGKFVPIAGWVLQRCSRNCQRFESVDWLIWSFVLFSISCSQNPFMIEFFFVL